MDEHLKELLCSLTEEELAEIPELTSEEIKAALERGRERRRKAERYLCHAARLNSSRRYN